jgi:hypothetical protein
VWRIVGSPRVAAYYFHSFFAGRLPPMTIF